MLAITLREAPNRTLVSPAADDALGDLRFRKLLAKEEWDALPPAVRRRFTKRLSGGKTAVYVGEVLETRLTVVGWVWAFLARLIGGPLPTSRDAHVPSVVTVTEDFVTGAQMWTRLYARRRGFPQVIRSSKQFSGATGLEECVGGGVGMALDVSVEDEALTFRSAGYFLKLASLRMAIPWWLTPGAMTIAHREIGEGRFTFTLDVVHPLFGTIIHQVAAFKEAGS
jgi:hypothetical protein